MVAALIPLAAAAIPAIASYFSNRSDDVPARTAATHPAAPAAQTPAIPAGPLVSASGHMVTSQRVTPAQAQVGRATVARVNTATHPLLTEIAANQRARANQIQATAEHRTIVSQQAWRDDMTRRLQRIEADVMYARTARAGGPARSIRY